ncbi:MAG: ATP-binding protein [Spirochaetes bacterium]|nr:ATP-binding protein [Spirochaetota bacterium]
MKLNEILADPKPPTKEQLKLSYKDFVRFYWKYRGLVKEKERNAAFWESTNENLKEAYNKLDEQERLIERAYQINKRYLDNIQEGLLLVDKNLFILGEYSHFLEKIFHSNQIAGKNILDFVYPDQFLSANERAELKEFIEMLFHNLAADMEMLEDVNPLKNKSILVHVDHKTNIDKVINAQFFRIFNKDHVENIMIIIQDKTNLVKMQKMVEQEKMKHESEIESISAILKAGPNAFLDFCEETKDLLNNFYSKLEDLANPKVISYVFREMHSIKGSAKYFHLVHLASIAHEAENILSNLKAQPQDIQPASIEEIRAHLDDIMEQIIHIEEMNQKIIDFSQQLSSKKSTSEKATLENYLKQLQEMIISIANDLDKKVKIKINNTLTHFPFLKQLKNPMIHLIRNCLDHGIEPELERISLNKKVEGLIKLDFHIKDGNYYIEITDDGSGINYDKIKKKAIERQLIQSEEDITQGQLLSLIFRSDFSSKDNVSLVSGRGMGLDIVKEAIEKLGGKIAIKTKKDRGTKIQIIIPEKRKKRL